MNKPRIDPETAAGPYRNKDLAADANRYTEAADRSCIRAVIFDLDGLLIDSEKMTWEGYCKYARQLGLEFPKSLYIRLLGKPESEIIRIMEEYFGSVWDGRKAMNFAQEDMKKRFECEGIPLKKGVAELLDFLEEHHIQKALATSSIRNRVDFILEQTRAKERFDVIVCGNEIQKGKPAPDIFLAAADQLHLPAHQCLVAEDSQAGILAASNGKIPVVCIPDLKIPEPECAALCQEVLTDLSALKMWIEKRLRSAPVKAGNQETDMQTAAESA